MEFCFGAMPETLARTAPETETSVFRVVQEALLTIAHVLKLLACEASELILTLAAASSCPTLSCNLRAIRLLFILQTQQLSGKYRKGFALLASSRVLCISGA